MSGNNTFAELNLPAATTQTITFTDGSTQSFAACALSGDATHTHTLKGSSTGGWTLSKTGGGTVTADYLNIQYGRIAADGAVWNPGTHSVRDANTTGWDFWSFGAGMVNGISPRAINGISPPATGINGL